MQLCSSSSERPTICLGHCATSGVYTGLGVDAMGCRPGCSHKPGTWTLHPRDSICHTRMHITSAYATCTHETGRVPVQETRLDLVKVRASRSRRHLVGILEEGNRELNHSISFPHEYQPAVGQHNGSLECLHLWGNGSANVSWRPRGPTNQRWSAVGQQDVAPRWDSRGRSGNGLRR